MHNILCEIFDEDFMALKVLVDWGPDYGDEQTVEGAHTMASDSNACTSRYTYEVKLNADPKQWSLIENHTSFDAIRTRMAAIRKQSISDTDNASLGPPQKRSRYDITEVESGDDSVMSVNSLLLLIKDDDAELAKKVEEIILQNKQK